MSLEVFVQFLFDVAVVACGTITVSRVWFEGSIFEPFRQAFIGKYHNSLLLEDFAHIVGDLPRGTPILRPGLVGFIDERAPIWLCELVSCRLCLSVHLALWLALAATLNVWYSRGTGLVHALFYMAGAFFCGHAVYMLLSKVNPILAPDLNGKDE